MAPAPHFPEGGNVGFVLRVRRERLRRVEPAQSVVFSRGLSSVIRGGHEAEGVFDGFLAGFGAYGAGFDLGKLKAAAR